MTRPPGIGDAVRKQMPDYVVKEVADLKRSVRELRQSLGAITGFTFVNGKIMSATFDGDLDVPSAGTTGVALGGPHDTLIVNTLVAANAIIDDDALTSPVKTAAFDNTSNGFTWTTSAVARASVTVTVPAGFTTAGVIATGFNNTTVAGSPSGSIYLYARVDIDAVSSDQEYQLLGSAGGGSVGACLARQIGGLSGGDTFTVRTLGSYSSSLGGSVPASAGGGSRVSALVTFTR